MTIEELVQQARNVTNRAIKQVEDAADEEWLNEAYTAVVKMILTREDFIADDVWYYTGLSQPREPSALGPVIKNVAKAGLIEHTEAYKLAYMPSRHRNPQRVWRSLIY